MKLAISPAAAGLLRALISRTGVDRDRILLTDFRSVDWQSLTFFGERLEMELRISGRDARAVALRLTDGLADAEFSIPGQTVADIGLKQPLSHGGDGSVTIHLEALMIAE